MGSVVVEAVGECIDEGLQLVEAVGQVVGGVELVAPGAVASLDGSVELRPLGREHIEVEALDLTGSLEVGLELGPAVDLDARDVKGHVGDELVEEAGGEVCGGAAADAGHGPFGDWVVSGEVLDRLRPGAEAEEQRYRPGRSGRGERA